MYRREEEQEDKATYNGKLGDTKSASAQKFEGQIGELVRRKLSG